jgi:hypothetical protein
MNWKIYVAWFFPIWIYIAVICGKLLYATAQIYPMFLIGAIGITLTFITGFILIGLILKHPIGHILASIGMLVGCIITITLFIGAHGEAYQGLFAVGLYSGIFGIVIFMKTIRQEYWLKLHRDFLSNIKKNPKSLKKVIAGIICMGMAGTGMILIRDYPGSSVTFEISANDAQNYDLVVYFPDYNAINVQICEIFQEVNATLSFPMSEKEFQENDTRNQKAADAVKLLNQYGVRTEIWPLFEWEDGSYPSISEMNRWGILYEKFHNWTMRHNITVEYLLWDIESGGESANYSDVENWIEPFKTFGKMGASGKWLRDVDLNWQDALTIIRNLSQQSKADGHIMRTTTHTIIHDLFDGDSDIQKNDGLPVWDAGDAFEYISMMAYLGCEWGGTTTPDLVYENVRLSAISQPGQIAICIGCINYTPYPTIEPIVRDVRLSLAAGCHSVRLFQANSWISGVGVWNSSSGNMVYGGPAHGVDGETGLRQLLQACRESGTVTYTPTRSYRAGMFASIFQDIVWDFGKPYLF